jgi:hypothetical protein
LHASLSAYTPRPYYFGSNDQIKMYAQILPIGFASAAKGVPTVRFCEIFCWAKLAEGVSALGDHAFVRMQNAI